jgi:hypothetical protein
VAHIPAYVAATCAGGGGIVNIVVISVPTSTRGLCIILLSDFSFSDIVFISKRNMTKIIIRSILCLYL